MRIALLNPTLPFPPLSGAQLRTFHLAKCLARAHEVTIVGFGGEAGTPPPFPVRTVRIPWEKPSAYVRLHDRNPLVAAKPVKELAWDAREPWYASIFSSSGLKNRVRKVFKAGRFDLIMIEHSGLGVFLPALSKKIPIVLDMHNVHTLIAKRERDTVRGRLRKEKAHEFTRSKRFETRVARACALCLTVSKAEALAAEKLLGVRPAVVENGVDTRRYQPSVKTRRGHDILFTGTMNYPPNEEGVLHFRKTIWPLILKSSTNAVVHVAGAGASPSLYALAGPRFKIHGPIRDMRRHFREAAVIIVPLLSGGGTRLKILEAAACGKAIVSTPFGAEGLDFVGGRDLLLAETPRGFAAQVLRVLRSSSLARKLGRNARRAAEKYDWELIGERFRRMIEEVV